MRYSFPIFALLAAVLTSGAWAADSSDLPISCGNGLIGGVNCIATRKEQAEARRAYEQGMKLHQRQHFEEALERFDEAVRLDPQDPQFLSTREVLKARLVFDHMERGNLLLAEDARLRAAGEFRAALDLDPENGFARARFAEATREIQPSMVPLAADLSSEYPEIHLEPSNLRATFHFTGDIRDLFTQLAVAYQMNVLFDESVQARAATFNVDNLDFFTALRLACQVSKTMWTALDAHRFLIAADNTENRRHYERMVLQRFVLPPHASQQEATDLVNTMRNMCELKFLSSGQNSDSVEIRGPQADVEICGQLLRQLSNERPQVMLDVRVFQIDHQLTRNIGLHVPNTFNLYNIPAAALAGLAGQNLQQLINQLIASGGINQVGSTALSGLLAQLQGQQNSIFSQPLATFGGGLTFMGLSLDQLAAALSVNESWSRSLENLQMRASQGNEASFHLGERYPILNASYAPIYNSPQIAQVLGNQSYIPPFPSVSYEDLGLSLKAKPTVQGDGSVTLQLDLQVRSLTGQSNNGVPIISNKQYTGTIRLKDGEPAFVAGEISSNDTRSMSGIPGLGFVPGLNMAMVSNTKTQQDDELLISITPHVVSNFDHATQEIWLSQN